MQELLITLRKWLLLLCLLTILGLFFYYDLYHYLNLKTLKLYQFKLQEWTKTHYQSMIVGYMILFTLMIACAIPCATFLTLLGGYLFGIIALLYAMFATTLGGIILYLAVRSTIGDKIKARSSGVIKKMELGFQENAFNYLLMLRLVPIFPCWFSNISAGALNIPLKTFIVATMLGIAPSTFIYIMVGRGLDKVVNTNHEIKLNLLMTPSILFPLLALAMLSLVPVIWKWRTRGND